MLISVVICFFFFAFSQLIFGLNYEMLDEMIFSELIADNYIHFGNFSNYILLAGIMLIQKVIYPLNAYAIVALMAALAAMITIVYIFYCRFSLRMATMIAIVLNGMIGINHYATISFTRLPALLCTAGLLCILHSVYTKRWIAGVLWGSLLVLAASMYRYKVFLVGALVFVVFLLADAVSEHLHFSDMVASVKQVLKVLLEPRRLIAGMLLFAVCFGFSTVGRKLNNNSEEVAYYMHYSSLRSAVWDYAIPSYEEAKADYDVIGIDENDLFILDGHYLDDQGAFPEEKLAQIKAIRQKYYGHSDVKALLKKMIDSEWDVITHVRDKAILYFSVLLVLALFLIMMKKRYYLMPFLLLLLSAALYVYLYMDGRVPYRVVYGFWLPIMIYLIYSIQPERMKKACLEKLKQNKLITSNKYAVPCLGLATLVAVSFLTITDYRNFKNDFTAMQQERASVNEYVKAHPDDRFELCRPANLFEGNIDEKTIYTVNNEGRYKNSHIFNGTYYRLPYYDKFNEDVFGTDNLFENLLNEHVYYIDYGNTYGDALEEYLEKYYSGGKNVEATLVDEIGNYKVISFTIAE